MRAELAECWRMFASLEPILSYALMMTRNTIFSCGPVFECLFSIIKLDLESTSP